MSVNGAAIVEMTITSEGDNGILFEGTEGRFFVNRGKIIGKPVEALKDTPLPDGAIEEVYGGFASWVWFDEKPK